MIDLTQGNWLKQEFELGGRQWRINKLSALRAKDVLEEHVRPCMASMDGIDLDSETAIAVLFGRIPYVHLKALGIIFAKECIKTQNDVGQWVPLATDPEQYTQGMEPMDLVMLDMRCLAVNFSGSFSSVVSNLVELAGIDISQLQKLLIQ